MAMIMAVKPTPLHYKLNSNTSYSMFRSNISQGSKSAYPTVRMQTRIHRLIEDQGIVLIPGCYDALSAAIIQKSRFGAAFISSYAVSASFLCKPDFGLLTSPEIAATARTVCAAAPMIPIIVDAETGGGTALNVRRTIKDLIAAGAAGCVIEALLCIRIKHGQRSMIIPAEEHAAKIASARDAIEDSDFFLIARTDARALAKTGLSEAIARDNLYIEAGADASFVEAPRDDEELKEIGHRTKWYRVCDMYEGGVTPWHIPEEVKAMGFHLIVHPLTAFYASARALKDLLKMLKEKGTSRDHLHKMATFEEFNLLVNLEFWFELDERYLNLKNVFGTKL